MSSNRAKSPTARKSKRLTDTERKQIKEFASALVRHMSAQKISSNELAARSGLRAATIRSYREGRNRPTQQSLRRLSMALGEDLSQAFAHTTLAGADEELFRIITDSDGVWATIELKVVRAPIEAALIIGRTLVDYGVLGRVPGAVHEPAAKYTVKAPQNGASLKT